MILRKILSLAFCATLLLAGGCAKEEEPAEEIREELQDVGDEMKDVADETAEQVKETMEEVKEEIVDGN